MVGVVNGLMDRLRIWRDISSSTSIQTYKCHLCQRDSVEPSMSDMLLGMI